MACVMYAISDNIEKTKHKTSADVSMLRTAALVVGLRGRGNISPEGCMDATG